MIMNVVVCLELEFELSVSKPVTREERLESEMYTHHMAMEIDEMNRRRWIEKQGKGHML